jgi:hypothetical protein
MFFFLFYHVLQNVSIHLSKKFGGIIMNIKKRAAELRREYMRNWRTKNKERVRKYTQAYWERKASEELRNRSEKESETQ